MKFIMVMLLTIITSSSFANNKLCISKYSNSIFEEKRIYQSLIQDITLTSASHFSHIGAINKELQTQLAYRQKLRLEFLNKVSPERVKYTYSKTGRIDSISWEKTDEDAFMEIVSNRIINSKISVLKKQNQNHKDWPKFREYFKINVLPSVQYKKIQSNLFNNTKLIRSKLKKCFQ